MGARGGRAWRSVWTIWVVARPECAGQSMDMSTARPVAMFVLHVLLVLGNSSGNCRNSFFQVSLNCLHVEALMIGTRECNITLLISMISHAECRR